MKIKKSESSRHSGRRWMMMRTLQVSHVLVDTVNFAMLMIVDHHRHEPGTYKEGDALAHGGKSTKHMDDPVKRDLGLRAFPTDDNTTANHLSEPYPQPFQPRDPPPPSTQAASTVAHDSTHNISSMNFVASSPNEAGIGGMGQESKDGDHDTGWIPRGRAYSPLGGLPTGAGQAGRWSSSTNL